MCVTSLRNCVSVFSGRSVTLSTAPYSTFETLVKCQRVLHVECGSRRKTRLQAESRKRGRSVADVTAAGGTPPKLSVWQKAMFGIGSAAFGVKDGGFNVFL